MLRWLSLGLAAACFLVLFRIGVLVPKHITLNANEGWNAYHAAGVIAGQPLYPSPPRLFVTNYPPLSFYIVAAAGAVVGDVVLAGRLISLLSFLVWTAALALTARRLGCAWDEAVFAAMLLAVHILIFADYYVGADDPQMLAHAVAAFGPYLLWRERRSNARLFAAALLFTAAIFVKHNLIAIPLASAIWLLTVDRPAGARLVVFGALLGTAGLGACIALFGPGFLQHLTWPRGSTAGKLLLMTRYGLPMLIAPLAILGVLLARARRDPGVRLAATMSLIALAIAEATLPLTGVYWNTMFDAAWALGLTVALALNRLPRGSGIAAPRLRLTIAAASLAAPLAVFAASATIHWGSPRFWRDPRWWEVQTSNEEVAFLAAHPGRALCENMALCFWAGKPVEVDFFNMSNSIRDNPSADAELRRLIDSKAFAVGQLDDPRHDLGPGVEAALKRNYVIDHEGTWGSMIVPRKP